MELGAQTYDLIGRYNGKPSAILAIYQLPGANAVEAALGVRKRMNELKQRFPADLASKWGWIRRWRFPPESRKSCETLFEALVLVILVVYLFLQGWRATLIPLLAVPVSLDRHVYRFSDFWVFRSIRLSLFGLVLAIGLVVDDAIVVVEAVEHHIEEGMTPRDASMKAMEEVSGPVVAIALILTAVFVPTVFIPGITGRLYQQFAVTIAISVLFSAFNALSLSPALCALLLKPKTENHGPLARFFKWFNRVFGRATDGYVGFCAVLIRKSGFSLAVSCAGGGGRRFDRREAANVIPARRRPGLFVRGHGAAGRVVAAAHRGSGEKVEDVILKTPGVQGCTSVVGFSLLELHAEHLQLVLLRDAEGLGPAQEDGRAVHGDSEPSGGRAFPIAGRHCFLLSAAGDSGRRSLGRSDVRSGGPLRAAGRTS